MHFGVIYGLLAIAKELSKSHVCLFSGRKRQRVLKYKSVESLILGRCAGDYLLAGDSELLSFSMLRTSNIEAFDRVGGSPLSRERAPTIHEI